MANLSVIQPQDSQNGGQSGQCHSKVCGCQHRQKIVHGLMEAMVIPDEKEKGTITKKYGDVNNQ